MTRVNIKGLRPTYSLVLRAFGARSDVGDKL
jgi:hypothetical protein